MASFYHKRITEENINEVLRDAREHKGMSRAQAAHETGIREVYLAALEDGNYDRLPQGVYAKNFLREYCKYLGLRYQPVRSYFEREVQRVAPSSEPRTLFSHKRIRAVAFLSLPKVVRNSMLVMITLAFAVYLLVRLQSIIAPPMLEVSFPPPNLVTAEDMITVSGVSEEAARIFVNGAELVSTDGVFSHSVHLQRGINIITVQAQKQYGRDTEIVRQVLVR